MNFVSHASDVRIVLWSHSRYSYAFQQERFGKKRRAYLCQQFPQLHQSHLHFRVIDRLMLSGGLQCPVMTSYKSYEKGIYHVQTMIAQNSPNWHPEHLFIYRFYTDAYKAYITFVYCICITKKWKENLHCNMGKIYSGVKF